MSAWRGVEREVALALVDEAHQTCAYAKATRRRWEWLCRPLRAVLGAAYGLVEASGVGPAVRDKEASIGRQRPDPPEKRRPGGFWSPDMLKKSRYSAIVVGGDVR
jgi:hypothetical protein